MRAIFAPATQYSDSLDRPSCSECGTATVLIGIEPDGPGRELHTFQCPKCENFELAVEKAALGRSLTVSFTSGAKPMMVAPTNHLLATLPSSVGHALRLKRHVLSKDQVLFEVREPIRRVYFPVNAVVSLIIPLSNGHAVETVMAGRDGVVGALAAFGAKNSTSRAVVQIAGESLSCEVEALTSAAANFPELRSIIISHQQALLAHAQQSAACNATHKLESRLARRLLRAVDLHGGQQLLLTQDCLAQMLGARRTTVTLIAESFKDAGMITYMRGRIIICDSGKLQNVACECYQAVKSNYDALLSGQSKEHVQVEKRSEAAY